MKGWWMVSTIGCANVWVSTIPCSWLIIRLETRSNLERRRAPGASAQGHRLVGVRPLTGNVPARAEFHSWVILETRHRSQADPIAGPVRPFGLRPPIGRALRHLGRFPGLLPAVG